MKLREFNRPDGSKVTIDSGAVQAVIQHNAYATKIIVAGHELLVSESYETAVNILRGYS